MGRLDGKVALITGAGDGFGREFSLLFAKEGAKVVAVDWVPEGGEQTVKMITDSGCEAIFVEADVSKSEDAQGMIKAAVDEYGGLDILCNNAGVVGLCSLIPELTLEQWYRTINVDLTGVFLGMKYGIPEMLKTGGGSIINTSSAGGVSVVPDVPADYAAAKAGVIMLTKVAAIEFARQGIRVNCICPGHCLTPMVDNFLRDNAGFANEFNERIPMGRMGAPQEVAQAALYLACGETSSFVTGLALVIDGGHTIAARGNRPGSL
jgi:NAD(P)-dependent dehydrogenase (short-subunit alcohol dehydrogenase family)